MFLYKHYTNTLFNQELMKTFIKPGAFSQAYNTQSPSREMQGGRRQTAIFSDDNSVPVEEVRKLLSQARGLNNESKKKKSKSKQQQVSESLAQARRSKPKSPTATSPNHTWGASDRFAEGAPDHIITKSNPQSELVLPDPPKLGNTLSSRASAANNSPTKAVATRVSSHGTVLRRGSQVGAAPRQQVRQYRHPREMEAALIDSEAKIALLEDKLDATTSVLRRTQQELLQRNADLEAADLKTNSLMLMVQELLQHVVEKREGRRFSETSSLEIEKIMNQPMEHYSKNSDMQNYIDSKINAIDDLLPKWTSLPSEFMTGGLDDDSNFGDDVPLPPPLPPQASRR